MNEYERLIYWSIVCFKSAPFLPQLLDEEFKGHIFEKTRIDIGRGSMCIIVDFPVVASEDVFLGTLVGTNIVAVV